MPRTAIQPQSLWFDEPEKKKKSYFLRKMNKLRHRSQITPRSISAPFGFDHIAHIDSDVSFGLDKAFNQADTSVSPLSTQGARVSIAVCDKYSEKPLPRSRRSVVSTPNLQFDVIPKRNSFAAFSSYRTTPTMTPHTRNSSIATTRNISPDGLRHSSMISNSSSIVANSLFTKSSTSSQRTSMCSSPHSASGKQRSSSVAYHCARENSVASALYSIPQELEAGFGNVSESGQSTSTPVKIKHASTGSDYSYLSQVLAAYGDSGLNGDVSDDSNDLTEKERVKRSMYLDLAGDADEGDEDVVTLKKLDVKDIRRFRNCVESPTEMRFKILSDYKRANRFKVKSKRSVILPSQKGVCLLKEEGNHSNVSVINENAGENSLCGDDKYLTSLKGKEPSVQEGDDAPNSEEPESREELNKALQNLTVKDN